MNYSIEEIGFVIKYRAKAKRFKLTKTGCELFAKELNALDDIIKPEVKQYLIERYTKIEKDIFLNDEDISNVEHHSV